MIQVQKNTLSRLAKEIKEGVVVLHGSSVQYRNADTWYPFRQNSNFHYLTGWPEPDAHAIIRINQGKYELFLFVLDRNEELETWEGKRLGREGAEEVYGATKAFSTFEFKDRFPELVEGYTDVYIDYSSKHFEDVDNKLLNVGIPYGQRGAEFSKANLHPILPIISEMRLVKTKEEIDSIKKACDITVKGHIGAMKITNSGLYEYQVAAEMEKIFISEGAERLGYPSIVAGGANACILHYSTNREVLKEKTLLLIDAAAEYEMYSSDVTRTFPVSGNFSSEQKDIYQEVLEAQNTAIEAVVEGATMRDIHKKTVKKISRSLVELGLVPYGVDETVSMMHYFEFFMHGTGHWLGLDVHDSGSTEKDGVPRKLERGMVTTIEPGIYIRQNKQIVDFPILERDPIFLIERRQKIGLQEAMKLEQKEIAESKKISHEIPKNLLGIGVRIEDDIVCTEGNPLNLTSGIPREVSEIENLCNS